MRAFLLSAALATLAACSPDAVTGPNADVRGGVSGTTLTPDAEGLAYARSRRSVDQTFDALTRALEAAPPVGIVAQIDHAANAANAGLDLRPTRVVLFGNPALGTPLMQRSQTAGIDLPQKVLVYENAVGQVLAAYNTTDYLADRHGLAGVETLPTIAGALERFVGDVTVGTVKTLPSGVTEGEGLVVTASADGIDETYSRLRAAITGNPNLTLAAELDHQANAARVGQELRPTRLLVFGNPALGTPLMQREQTIGLDLPQKMLVWEDAAGDVFVAYNDPFYLAERHGLDGADDALDAIAGALATLAAVATGS